MIAKLSFSDLLSVAPIPIVLIGAVVLLLMTTFLEKRQNLLLPTMLFIFSLAFISLFFHPREDNPLLVRWICFDRAGQIFTGIFLLIGILAALIATPWLRTMSTRGEYYFLLTSVIFGLLIVGSSCDFLPLFLGIETLSISLYVMCGYLKTRTLSHEGALKYFLLGALSTAFLLYGIALIYGATGTTSFETISYGYRQDALSGRIFFLTGMVFITLAIAFKASLVPFHAVYPDVYEGAPLPVVALMSTGTKIGAFAAFFRIFMEGLPNFHSFWEGGALLLILPSLVIGNLGAIRQREFNRFFAYTGISHAAFFVLAVAAGGERGLEALLFYAIAYLFATLGAFAVGATMQKDRVFLEDFQGFFRKSPFLSSAMTLFLLSLAGLPPLAGFFAKFIVFKEAYEKGFIVLVGVALVAALFSAYYYLRFIAFIFSENEEESEPIKIPTPLFFAVIVCGGAIVVLSLFPGVFLSLLKS